jgi:hypothetical protein
LQDGKSGNIFTFYGVYDIPKTLLLGLLKQIESSDMLNFVSVFVFFLLSFVSLLDKMHSMPKYCISNDKSTYIMLQNQPTMTNEVTACKKAVPSPTSKPYEEDILSTNL